MPSRKQQQKNKKPLKTPRNLKILSGVSAATSILGATGATVLAIENRKLKNIVADLQERLAFYRKAESEPDTMFSFFGKNKRQDSDTILIKKELTQCENNILKFKEENKKLIKENDNLKKDLVIIDNNFKLCDSKLQECNKSYITLQKSK